MAEKARVLGINFFTGTVEESVRACDQGGLVIAPSGPGLAVDLKQSPAYRAATQSADVILPDSGFMVLIWNLLRAGKGPAMERLSGLKFIRGLLADASFQKPGASFWVMPSASERDRNLGWLKANGFAHLSEEDCYLAPNYRAQDRKTLNDPSWTGPFDLDLLRVLEEKKPAYVILNIGGGIQEPLGCWLKSRLSYQPAIICTGAALAFVTGGQANIPTWADAVYLGWLFRIASNPKSFTRRYVEALGLLPLLLQYRSEFPPLEASKG